MFELNGKVALVTGGRRGIGAACARALATQGAKVAITDIDEGECTPVADEIRNAGGEADCFKLDVTNAGEVDEVVGKIVEKYGRLDILVNNAGIYEPKPFLDMTEEDWDRTIAVNLKGQFLCAKSAAKEMAKNTWGRIINIASIASGQVGVGVGASVHYTASKGGVTGMTEAMAIDLAPHGINVNAIGPGAIDTPMVGAAHMPKEQMDAIVGDLLIKRLGRPEEIAAMAVYLASEEAGYTTGATFFVDGGWLAT